MASKGRTIPLYATQSDMDIIVRKVSEVRSLIFVAAGMFEKPVPTVVSSIACALNSIHFSRFLILDEKINVGFREVPQRLSGALYSISLLENSLAIELQLGRRIGDTILTKSALLAAGAGNEIFLLFAAAIRGKFKKIQSFYVGPEALRMFDEGARLTPFETSTKAYDLVR